MGFYGGGVLGKAGGGPAGGGRVLPMRLMPVGYMPEADTKVGEFLVRTQGMGLRQSDVDLRT